MVHVVTAQLHSLLATACPSPPLHVLQPGKLQQITCLLPNHQQSTPPPNMHSSIRQNQSQRLPVLDSVLEYEKLHRIGEGTYGVVYKGVLPQPSVCQASVRQARNPHIMSIIPCCCACSSAHIHWPDCRPEKGGSQHNCSMPPSDSFTSSLPWAEPVGPMHAAQGLTGPHNPNCTRFGSLAAKRGCL